MSQQTKILEIAREIFSQVRTTIVLNMRFMDMAVFRLEVVPGATSLATDGESLCYNPQWLLNRFRNESNAVTRDYLHVLLHCIFRHPFVHTLVNQSLWDLACDIAVEGLICELNQTYLTTHTEIKRKAVVDELRQYVKVLTAEKLYHYFQDHMPNPEWRELFRADDHAIWHSPAQAREMAQQRNQTKSNIQDGKSDSTNDAGEQQADNDAGNLPDDSADQQKRNGSPENSSDTSGDRQPEDCLQNESDDSHKTQPQNSDDSGDGDSPGTESQQSDFSINQIGDSSFAADLRQNVEDEWRDISEHIQMDLETFAKEQGLQAGSMQQLLAELNREKYDYEAFLKKFAVMGEVMKVNDDEFDYIFYTYGLKLFKNMPLIEPLEYKEVKRIREFVIAIDTSGSTSGELVNRFLTKTYNILMSTESFFSKVNIHIVQCDAVIQEVVKITCRDDFERYLQKMTIHGLGGTDFRPVFNYVDQLIHQHEFKHLKGLIYFTDGYGTFPEHKPDYNTAFVFIQDQYNNMSVPPWAIRLILEKEEI